MSTTLDRLGDDYVQAHYGADPFAATISGVAGFDAEVPDPSRAAAARLGARLATLATELAAVDPATLTATDRVSHGMLARLLRDQQETLRAGLDEVAVTATMTGPLAQVVSTVPAASVADPQAAQAYLDRLRRVPDFVDGWRQRYLDAKADGRYPTAIGVRQAIAQLDAYLATPVGRDPLVGPSPGVDPRAWRARAHDLVRSGIRPALMRYRATLADELLPVARPDERVGVCHVPGGQAGYAGLVRTHTTTELSADEIHRTGLDLVAQLRDEFADRGARALGTGDVAEVLHRLREDPALRFSDPAQIMEAATGPLRRAEAALPDRFHRYDIAPCVVREMDPAEAENAVLGYYLPPAADGSRPGAHVVNTSRPSLRLRFEYEALAFHESVPGHHLQFAVAQSRTDLPAFRRFAYVTAHSEGWGLYAERLCDQMGIYTDELSRLGMVSFDAWRACRLVVDTGLHMHGWSRARAIAYMRDNTALSATNIANEVDRYIADPGQALAYLIGRLRIVALRDRLRAERGSAFDIRAFHHNMLVHGSLPLDMLAQVADWAPAHQ
jgi:uncharacterized protein (DUF885 family)